MIPTFGSLFAGIGGLDLGLERAGWLPRWQVEIDPFCLRVLNAHWPDVPKYQDVREVGVELSQPDLICGGFPCQPVSHTGRRRGAHDDRWLWPEFARIVRLLRPRFVLVENVPGLLDPYEYPKRSGQWWPAPVAEVLGDLASSGYHAEWDCLPAAAVGAPHLRYRVWIVAYREEDTSRSDTDSSGSHRAPADTPGQEREVQPGYQQGGLSRSVGEAVSHTNGGGRQERSEPDGRTLRPRERPSLGDDPHGLREAVADPHRSRFPLVFGGEAFSQLARFRAVGSRGGWRSEPDVGRVAHGVPSRVDRLRSLGNAVVPQVVEWIGTRIIEEFGLMDANVSSRGAE